MNRPAGNAAGRRARRHPHGRARRDVVDRATRDGVAGAAPPRDGRATCRVPARQRSGVARTPALLSSGRRWSSRRSGRRPFRLSRRRQPARRTTPRERPSPIRSPHPVDPSSRRHRWSGRCDRPRSSAPAGRPRVRDRRRPHGTAAGDAADGPTARRRCSCGCGDPVGRPRRRPVAVDAPGLPAILRRIAGRSQRWGIVGWRWRRSGGPRADGPYPRRRRHDPGHRADQWIGHQPGPRGAPRHGTAHRQPAPPDLARRRRHVPKRHGPALGGNVIRPCRRRRHRPARRRPGPSGRRCQRHRERDRCAGIHQRRRDPHPRRRRRPRVRTWPSARRARADPCRPAAPPVGNPARARQQLPPRPRVGGTHIRELGALERPAPRPDGRSHAGRHQRAVEHEPARLRVDLHRHHRPVRRVDRTIGLVERHRP